MADGRLLAGLVGLTGQGPRHRRREVEVSGFITPDTGCVRYEVTMRQVRRGKLVLGIADGRVLADGSCVFTAKDMRVGLTKAVD